MSVDEVVAGLPEFVGEPQIGDVEFLETTVDGDGATTDVQWTFGSALDATRFALLREGGEWKIDGEEERKVEVPAGVEEVSVDALEFAFDLDTDAAASAEGGLAFSTNNIGQQEHELGLARIPADADIQELLQTEEEVPGFEFLGGVGPIAAGESDALVMLEPLAPGRYLMVCFLPDTSAVGEGQPHALLGMVREFTVAGAAQ
jgi:hypothetical protein